MPGFRIDKFNFNQVILEKHKPLTRSKVLELTKTPLRDDEKLSLYARNVEIYIRGIIAKAGNDAGNISALDQFSYLCDRVKELSSLSSELCANKLDDSLFVLNKELLSEFKLPSEGLGETALGVGKIALDDSSPGGKRTSDYGSSTVSDHSGAVQDSKVDSLLREIHSCISEFDKFLYNTEITGEKYIKVDKDFIKNRLISLKDEHYHKIVRGLSKTINMVHLLNSSKLGGASWFGSANKKKDEFITNLTNCCVELVFRMVDTRIVSTLFSNFYREYLNNSKGKKSEDDAKQKELSQGVIQLSNEVTGELTGVEGGQARSLLMGMDLSTDNAKLAMGMLHLFKGFAQTIDSKFTNLAESIDETLDDKVAEMRVGGGPN